MRLSTSRPRWSVPKGCTQLPAPTQAEWQRDDGGQRERGEPQLQRGWNALQDQREDRLVVPDRFPPVAAQDVAYEHDVLQWNRAVEPEVMPDADQVLRRRVRRGEQRDRITRKPHHHEHDRHGAERNDQDAPDTRENLLQQAGYKGEVIDLWTGDGIFTNDHALTEALAAMFEQVGMRTRITILEPSVYGVQFRDPKFPVAIIAAPSDQYFDPDGGLYRLLLPGV